MNQSIDWSGIRAAAVTIGVREAARRAAVNLPDIERGRFVNRVLQRSAREKWIVHKDAANAQPVTSQAKPMSSTVITGANAAIDALADDSKATKIGFSKAARKVAEYLPYLSEVSLTDKDTAQAAKHWHGIASGTHGWESQGQRQGPLNLAILCDQAAVQINQPAAQE